MFRGNKVRTYNFALFLELAIIGLWVSLRVSYFCFPPQDLLAEIWGIRVVKLTCEADCSRLLTFQGVQESSSKSIDDSYPGLDRHKHAVQTPERRWEHRSHARVRPDQTLRPTDTHLAPVHESDTYSLDLLDVPSAR